MKVISTFPARIIQSDQSLKESAAMRLMAASSCLRLHSTKCIELTHVEAVMPSRDKLTLYISVSSSYSCVSSLLVDIRDI